MSARSVLLSLLAVPLFAAYVPPVIPHPLEAGVACTSCHGTTRASGVPGIPHRVQGDCKGCHVTQTKAAPWRRNTFRAEATRRVARCTFPGAPPAMGHPVFMRENCLACHGQEKHPGMKLNPHPGRPNCGSCHLPGQA